MMKTLSSAGALIFIATLMPPQFGRSQALQATITGVSNEITAGYVVGADKDGLLVSMVPEGGNAMKFPYANLKEYNI